MEFTVKIELGNDAMQSDYDVSGALYEIARKLKHEGTLTQVDGGKILDANGNTVGSWEIRD